MTGARRLDWRFLLPHPPAGFEHLILLGGNAALAGLAAELGLARRVSASLPVAERVDLIAVLDGAREDPRRVAAGLTPGGVWYWEIDRRSAPWTPFATARRLARAGLGPSTAYWIRGGFARPGMFLPLDRDAAFAWYFATIFRTPSVGRHALRAGLRILTGWRGRRFARLIRRYALVGGGQPPSVLSAVGTDVGDDARPLAILGGEGEWSRVTLVPFATGREAPRAVVKIARRPAFNTRTAQEQRFLRDLHTRAPAWLSASIPQPFGFCEWQGLGVGVESCAAGKQLYGELLRGAAGAARRLAVSGSWLAAFHEATQRARLHREALREQVVGAPLGAYEAAFGLAADEARLFTQARRHAERIGVAELPIVLQHGDFGPWNVFRNGREITVVDWEAAREGPALCDLVYFALHSEAGSRASDVWDVAPRLALPLSQPRNDPLAEAARRELLLYVRRLGIADELYPLLVLCTFVEQALERVARLREQGDPGAADRASNPYVACVGALAREPDGLFPEPS